MPAAEAKKLGLLKTTKVEKEGGEAKKAVDVKDKKAGKEEAKKLPANKEN